MAPIKRKMPTGILILMDILLAGAALCVFALFHHVLPQAWQGENITVARPGSLAISTADPAGASSSPGESSLPDAEISAAANSDAAISDTAETAANGSYYANFADRFTSTVVSTENTYTSPNVSISVSKEVTGSGSSTITYYIADVYIADITQLRTGFAKDTYGKGLRDTLENMDAFYDALLSVAGDYYGNHDDGIVIRNGVVYRSIVTNEDICLLYYDGTMETISPQDFDINEVIDKGAWQAWTFGPMLLDNGQQMTAFNASSYLMRSHPRTAIGYYEPGHYCFVVIDGREKGYSSGMTLSQMSELFATLGCKAAYNLDGGKSAVMVYNDNLVNQPADGGRTLSDMVYISEVIP